MEEQYGPQLEPNDEVLIAQVIRRDVEAFGLLYDRYARSVYVMAVHMIGHSEAEEAVQEIFMRLWHKAEQYDPARGSFKAWFMSISRYYLLDQLRRHYQQQRLLAAEQIEQVLSEATDPGNGGVEEAVWLRQRGRAVLRALNQLPAEQRRAIVLAYFGGLSQSSIAEQLGWPLGTVKKRVRLGLQKLRKFLSGQGLAAETKADSSSNEQRI